MSTETKPPSAAFCEDFNEDSGNSLPETRKVANVAAKRSRPELAAKPAGNVDGTNDSDYSSRPAGTGATHSSTESESESKRSQAPMPLKLDTTFQDKPSIQDRERRPYGGEMKLDSGRPRENRPAVQRRSSKTRKEEHPHGSCWDCEHRGGHAPTPKPSSQPAKTVTVPSSPSRPRKETSSQPKHEHKPQEHAEGRPRPRRSSSAYRSASRPASFHAGTSTSLPPEPAYSYLPYSTAPQWSQMAFYSPYTSCPPSSFPTTFPTPVTPIHTAPIPSYYEQSPLQEPAYSRRRSGHGPPVIRQDYPPSPADRRPPSPRKIHRESSVPRRQDREEDYQGMPPPPRPQSTIPRRPSIKKHVTTTSAEALHQSKHSDPRPPSRSSSHRRPSDAERHVQLLTRPQNRKTVSYEDTAAPTRQPERPITRRRTIYGHEPLQDLERKQWEAEEYQRSKGTDPLPMTADSLHKARTSAAPAKKSEVGSHRSRNSSNKESTVKAQGSDITMTMNGVALGFSNDSVDNKDIRIKSKPSGSMSIQIEGKKSRRYSFSRIQGPPGEKERDKLMRADSSEKGSRKSSRSGRSGK